MIIRHLYLIKYLLTLAKLPNTIDLFKRKNKLLYSRIKEEQQNKNID